MPLNSKESAKEDGRKKDVKIAWINRKVKSVQFSTYYNQQGQKQNSVGVSSGQRRMA